MRAFVQRVPNGATRAVISAEKSDGTPVLIGTASIGPDYGVTEVSDRMAKLRPSGPLVILSDLEVGQRGTANGETVSLGFDEPKGNLYPYARYAEEAKALGA